MSEFFSHYPQLNYDISGAKPVKTKRAINIMLRTKIKSTVLDDIVAYFPYVIPEAERPDVTAFKIYGNVKFTWLIFLINDIHDPIYEWPLNTREFGNFVKHKYGTLASAKNTVHHYEEIVRQRVEATNTSDPIPEAIIQVDKTSYDSLAVGSRKIIYCYEYEVNKNEDKRSIKLIDPTFAAGVFSEQTGKFK